ncbi:hypothetical protein CC1G_11688 [Coprinopsis cinerea okayama7|uniref:Peptidase A1 domain-containing protein n=1 Tax=Coprinopsis cinerea (strain Okayama-7 / 130 / ATCC MYA-4618 / FGSC 9003) TaxID=240176 RepID=A8NRH1_COPC7|nr:hypothetical protein CC1G_11688 [Coprinopsis cinerea okayama7\|eukprot:XP_001835783.1 hypothetical protein CC1G_11688 [Coprinopsis cinerea okayama7\
MHLHRTLTVLAFCALPTIALRLPIHHHPSSSSSTALAKRGSSLSLHNLGDRHYYADIELGGQNYTVLIDTGSSDLWVAGTVPRSTDTGVSGELAYAKDTVQGPIKTATLRFGDYSVRNQAFLEITPDEIHPQGEGLLGLGPSTGSFIAPLLDGHEGDPPLYRVFNQSLSTPNYFTILLGREKDPTDHFTGSVTIGEVLPEYQSILNETRLRFSNPSPDTGSAHQLHLQVLLDADGIIGPDGEPIPIRTEVAQAEDPARATVVLDSGFSLPQVPKYVSDAIYSRFSGAEYVMVQNIGGIWILPCTVEVNVTVKFAGKEYPIHPLDMTLEPEFLGYDTINNARGENMCLGTFQPYVFERGDFPSYDMIFGMAFMRNVYALFDYGDFLSTSTSQLAEPYIQLLSLTDREEAHSDFVTVRLNGTERPNKGLRDDDDKDSGGNGGPTKGRMHSAIVAAVAVIGVLLLVAGFFVWRARRKGGRV